MQPQREGPSGVSYQRGALVEQYLAQTNSLTQQFVLPQPLPLSGADLVLTARLATTPTLETEPAPQPEGLPEWDSLLVRASSPFEPNHNLPGLSCPPAEGTPCASFWEQVRVFDAQGIELPVVLTETAESLGLEVDGSALESASYPITIEAELDETFRISDMGPDGDQFFFAFNSSVAYNSAANEYLVVWHGNDNTGSLVHSEYEIFGQRLNGASGAEIGNDFRISDMGPDGNPNFWALRPAIAYNSVANEYLVVWTGDDNTPPLVDNEFEIFGQRLNATGTEIGSDFRISDMGPDQENKEDERTKFGADFAAVTYNSDANQYLVVWTGDDNISPLVDNEFEIFGERLNAAGELVGANDFRISDMGPDGATSYEANIPAVAYNSAVNEYLVVWHGDDNTGLLVNGEFEIFGQRLNGATGAEIGNDFRISDMGPDGDGNFGALYSSVTYNNNANEYLVVWYGDDNIDPLVNDELEIFGERLNALGERVGANDFRISDLGPDKDVKFWAAFPAVTYNSVANEYLVIWHGDDTIGVSDSCGECEIFGQRLNGATGAEVGSNDFRISDMGPDGNSSFDAALAAVAYNSIANEYLVVWEGNDNVIPTIASELEIYGQRLNGATGAEVGVNDFRLSDMGPDGNIKFRAQYPAIAYNSAANEYLVVWHGEDDTGGLVDDEYEIFGQRLNGATGAEVGVNDFRISDMGPDGNPNFGAFYPAVAYNSAANEYLVVWHGDDNTGGLADNEPEIFGQRLSATGTQIGVNDFRISDLGPDGNDNFFAIYPAVAYNSTANEYLVVWHGDDNTGGLVDDEYEIFGQRLNGASGAEIGTNDFRLSDMGLNGNTTFSASYPKVVYSSGTNEYLIVWSGIDNIGLVEIEIFGQRLNGATGAEVGTNDFRISDLGPEGDFNFQASFPAVAYNDAANEYLVVWHGDDNTAGLVDNEPEIFGQRLSATGAQVGVNDFRISDMGPDGNANFWTLSPTVAYNSETNEYLVLWYGDDNTAPLVDNEYEIFGQRLDSVTGTEIDGDFRISHVGPDGDIAFNAFNPTVAYNSIANEYLVVWWGNNSASLLNSEDEIFGQRLSDNRIFLPLILK
ncbi:MAG: hypothetical protein HC875_24070 [Anaerolineales bacterium]|nr:hypothetical protein [Anaerolineales bacterium]